MRIAESLFHLLVEIGVFLIWMEVLSFIVALPVAWLRMRRTRVWRRWPPGIGRIGALRRFIRPIYPRVIIVVGLAVLLLLAYAWVMDIEEVALRAYLLLIVGLPVALAAWLALQLDPREFDRAISGDGQG